MSDIVSPSLSLGDDFDDLYDQVWAVYAEDIGQEDREKTRTPTPTDANPPPSDITRTPSMVSTAPQSDPATINEPAPAAPFVDVRRGLPGTPQSSVSHGRYRPLPLPPPPPPSTSMAPSLKFPEADPYYDPSSSSRQPFAPKSPDTYPFANSPDQLKNGMAAGMNFPSPTEDGEIEALPPYRGEGPGPNVYVPPTHDSKVDLFPPTAMVPGSTTSAAGPAGPSVPPPPPPPPPLPLPPLAGPSDQRTAIHVYTAATDLPALNGFYQPETSNYRGPAIQIQPPFRITNDYVSPDQSQLSVALEDNSLDGHMRRTMSVDSSISSLPNGYALSNTTHGLDRSSSLATTVDPGPSAIGNHSRSNSEWGGLPYLSYDAATIGDYDGASQRTHDFASTASQHPRGHLESHDGGDGDFYEDGSEEDNIDQFINFAFLSNIAVQLRDKVPRGTHVKGSIPYPRAFTGKDIVSTIQAQIQREILVTHNVSADARRIALQVARSLQSQLFFYEVEWGGRVLQDGVEDVYMFMDDDEGGSDAATEREELPTGVITMLTKCYASGCQDNPGLCYAYTCPRRGQLLPDVTLPKSEPQQRPKDWANSVEKEVLRSLPESEINRQTIIHKVISKEEQYVRDLDLVESNFLRPLRMANPPVIRGDRLEEFIDDVFGNILEIRECNRRLLEVMYVRQREEAPVIKRIGDIFLGAATEFRVAYPPYVGRLPLAEKQMKEEIESNPEFRLFLEQCSRQSAKHQESIRLDLKHLLNRPSEHLQKYPVLLQAIFHETAMGNPDADYLMEAIEAITGLQAVAQLRTFQSAMGKGPTSKLDWADLVPVEIRKSLTKDENKRQSIIFELIKGEMDYVKDLENLETIFIRPLRNTEPPIIPRERLESFLVDVFHNFPELHAHHRRLVDQFHEIQREQHPTIRSVTAVLFDATLNFRDAYLQYIPNYPKAAYRVEEEMANNPAFKTFVEQCTRHPDAHRHDLRHFINRPIPRLLRYELLLKNILDQTPAGHEDRSDIPQVLEVIKNLGKETEPGVESAKQKVELWRYNSNLVFKTGEYIDMDLLDENRSLIHSGKLLRQPDAGFDFNWTELFVLLFDNYLVMTKPKEKEGVTKYHLYRRPIPLDLLTLANFTDPPTQRSSGIFRGLLPGTNSSDTTPSPGPQSPENPVDSRSVFPCTIHHNGRLGGLYTVYAESAQIRTEWKQKLEEATGLRNVVQESNKVFEIETLSIDTFMLPAVRPGAPAPTWSHENSFTGKVTCSVPFTTPDGRGLVAIGCSEGVWIGFRHDSRSMRRVLHLKMVTQCAMLEDFSIFLVLADKSLFAYHMEALVPSSPSIAHASQTPQKLNGNKDVHFFRVGTLHGRTLVIYMKKKHTDSVFRVLEPVVDNINERANNPPAGFASRFGFRAPRAEWFRIYRDFSLPSDSYDLIFLKAKIAILCAKGFEIMDLTDFRSVTIPQRDDPRLEKLARRCESCKPLGMFRTTDDEFLLCYDEFGLYVNKHGDPSRPNGTIEWEGTAERVALHPPYVLLFDSRFIEIRHVETGRLAQIIPGNDVRCIWDGRGVGPNVAATPGLNGHDDPSQEALVHAVMSETEHDLPPGSRPLRAVTQHVFELIPTIPLYLPGSLASPSTSTYFPQSSSPPHSPHLRPTLSWRS